MVQLYVTRLVSDVPVLTMLAGQEALLRRLPIGPAALESAVSTCRIPWRMQLSFADTSLLKKHLQVYRPAPDAEATSSGYIQGRRSSILA